MSKYLITGGAGFIGSHLVEYFFTQGKEVIIFDNLSTGRLENIKNFLGDKVKLIKVDISKRNQIKGKLKDVEIIFHLAAIPSVPKSIKDPLSTFRANVMGTINILWEAKLANVKRVIFASSSSVYGNIKELPIKEECGLNPISPYGLSKLSGELICKLFYKIYQLETVCLRYFNVFGPRQNPKSQYAAVIPKFIKRIIEGKRPIIYGDGSQTRDFTYISNVVKANILACQSNTAVGEAINIAAGKSHSLKELVNLINRTLGTSIKPVYSKERIGDIKHSLACIDKAKELINYECEVSFEEGLKRTIKQILDTHSILSSSGYPQRVPE